MVKIRLKRMGRKKRPFYRIVVADSRSPRDGRNIEEIGYYNPLMDPPDVRLDLNRVDYWIGNGAKPTDTVGKIIKFQREAQANQVDEARRYQRRNNCNRTRRSFLWFRKWSWRTSDWGRIIRMEDLVRLIAENLVDNPDEISITETDDNGEIFIELSVAEEDMGKIIGRQGKIAKAIRTVLKAKSILDNTYVDLKII